MGRTDRLRRLAHRFILVPVMRRWFGMRVTGGEHLPRRGPAIVVANHNSHLDTAALLAAFPTSGIDDVRPAAAADYFVRGRLSRAIFLRFVRIVPIDRSGGIRDPLGPVVAALDAGSVVVFFPEGTRGEPGVVASFRRGVASVAQLRPLVPIVPVWLSGCAEALPKGARLPRRGPVSVNVGPAIRRTKGESEGVFCDRLRATVISLGRQERAKPPCAA
jgi:1-acyl-sn-glycerol-3-phosphate acyltransferase